MSVAPDTVYAVPGTAREIVRDGELQKRFLSRPLKIDPPAKYLMIDWTVVTSVSFFFSRPPPFLRKLRRLM